MNLASIVIAGRALSWGPEGVFLAVVAIVTGLRISFQKSTWWHHPMDWFIAIVAVGQVPQVAAASAKINTNQYAAYGSCAILIGIMVFSFSMKKK